MSQHHITVSPSQAARVATDAAQTAAVNARLMGKSPKECATVYTEVYALTITASIDTTVCGTTGCGHTFTAGEMRYRTDDGRDHCLANGHGQAAWTRENGATR